MFVYLFDFVLSSVNYTTIIVTFSFQRRLGFYLLQVYVPDILIVLLSWIVFWLVPDDPGGRLTIGVTTVLTIMFQCGAVNVSLPPVSYAKAMDWYLMVSFAFVFLSVIESLVVFLLSTKPLGKTSKTKETVSLLFGAEYQHELKPSASHAVQNQLACTQTLFYFSFRSFRKHRRPCAGGQ